MLQIASKKEKQLSDMKDIPLCAMLKEIIK